MHHPKNIFVLMCMQVTAWHAFGQSDTAVVNVNLQSNLVNFTSQLRSLQSVPGAPSPFYSYFWEFGDGSFSFQENPKHIYKDTGTYDVRLYATNNYDDGKPPPTRPKPVRINSRINLAVNSSPEFFKQGGAIEMKVNRMPRPDEDMVLIIGYRNKETNSPLNGSLVLFYNEKEFRRNSFDLEEERLYHNEQKTNINAVIASVPSQEIMETSSWANSRGPNNSFLANNFRNRKFIDLLRAKQQMFRQNTAWHFDNLKQKEEKYFFITLHTTPEMLKDTNGVVTLTGMFVPDDANAQIEEYALELQIVTSHDPNHMMLKNQRLNYRFTGTKKDLTYKVQFQNTGKGAARQISVGIAVPQMMDARTVEIVDFYPKLSGSRKEKVKIDTIIHKDSIFFIFRNIYLPGLRQAAFSDPDSTIGFIKYKLHFSNELKKLPFNSRAAIVFDKNEPVYTNNAKGEFKPGRSFGGVIAYNKLIGELAKGNEHENYLEIGGSISPVSPYKKYLQAEMYLGFQNFPEEFWGAFTQNIDTIINGVQYRIIGREIYVKQKIIKTDIVPAELRYNITDYFGVGGGPLITFNAWIKSNFRETLHLIQPPNPTQTTMSKKYSTSQFFKKADVALFGDVQFGKVRQGPVIGIRYLHFFRFPQNRLLFYASWRL